jgi:predicted AAA+ superfamily ATPase
MDIPRLIEKKIEAELGKQKVIMLYGTRRTGKTTIIEHIAARHSSDVLLLQGEDMQVASLLQQRTVANYSQLTKGKKIVIIDEAQVIPEIGRILKLMIDNVKGISIIVTGSSSFDLVYRTGEPLVGRNIIHYLYPIAQAELSAVEDRLTTLKNLDQRLIYGGYPELWQLSDQQEQENYLKQMVNSYLLKDLLTLENVKGADVLYKLLQMLAWQIGSQVSTTELGNSLQLNKATVERYLDLLSKVFIIFPLSGYSSNLRKEVTKSKKWYFYDNGIRNALINNFSPLQSRNDIGQLWEQYILSERMKFNSYSGYYPQYFFWRTYDGQEIDLLELDNKQHLQAIECKWQNQKIKVPVAFSKAYPEATFTAIHQDNYLEWIAVSDRHKRHG